MYIVLVLHWNSVVLKCGFSSNVERFLEFTVYEDIHLQMKNFTITTLLSGVADAFL